MSKANRIRILVDMDGVLVDLLTPWLAELNKLRLPTAPLTQADITKYDLAQCPAFLRQEGWKHLRPSSTEIYAPLKRGELFAYAPPMAGAVNAFRQLMDMRFDVRVVSHSANEEVVTAKRFWLRHHLGIDAAFAELNLDPLARMEMFRTGMVDIVIDDAPGLLMGCSAAAPSTLVTTRRLLCFGHAYNRVFSNRSDAEFPLVYRTDHGVGDPQAWEELVDQAVFVAHSMTTAQEVG